MVGRRGILIRTSPAGWIGVALLAAATAAVVYTFTGVSPERWVDTPGPKADSVRWRVSVTLADTALVLFSSALLIGPFRVLREGRPAVHLPHRRRLGLAAAGFGATHLVLGLSVHGDVLRPWRSFSTNWPSPSPLPIPFTVLGLANWFGLGVALTLAIAAATSNRASMQRWGRRRWKAIQRVVYVAYPLLATHVVLYQKAERRWVAHRVLILTIVALVVALQLAAFIAVHRRSAPSPHGA